MPSLSERQVPQRKSTLTHEVTDTDEVVIYDSQGSQLLVLNHVAAGVWLMIDGKRSTEDITAEIVSHLDGERDIVARDVLAFLSQLEDRKLVTWKEAK